MSVAGSTSSPELHQQLAGSIATSLIQNDEVDPEQQPLRRNSPAANREHFQQNQRTAAQGVVHQRMVRSSWLLVLVVVLLVSILFVWAVFYCQGWVIWRDHRSKPCDQPLANWLLGMLLLPLLALFAECTYSKKLRILVLLVTFLVLLVGLRMFYRSKTCDSTNPELYKFVRHYLTFLAIWWISWVAMPTIFVVVVIFGMMHGWFDEINGASPEVIKQLETVSYDAALFAHDGNDDSKPPVECCICTETFFPESEIKRTTCQHYFHGECLGKWLRVSTTCPLCRTDLQVSTLGHDASTSAAAAASHNHWSAAGSGWSGNVFAEAAIGGREAEEVRALQRAMPGLDEELALDAVRQAGSAESAAAFLRSTGFASVDGDGFHENP